VEGVLLSAHVLAGIVFVGGSAVAASLFPRYAPVTGAAESGERNRAVAVAMHRISRGYGIAGIIVPAVGIALAIVQGRMGEVWITISMVLTAAAGVVLAWQIVPRQRAALAEPDDGARLRRLSMLAGIYNLLWAIVVVLMIVRPGAHS
jgi:Na+/proline symporter